MASTSFNNNNEGLSTTRPMKMWQLWYKHNAILLLMPQVDLTILRIHTFLSQLTFPNKNNSWSASAAVCACASDFYSSSLLATLAFLFSGDDTVVFYLDDSVLLFSSDRGTSLFPFSLDGDHDRENQEQHW
ncbi:hypothetical protein PIB30_065242 [Stylosanthes scabra]|uniref:Uncharacterized protein n=1 Tax=Stylosanthes scabra TaxID=79078 RepID=A0ABU6ZKP4_9FABA|nr:hypothetical protein [Stylosanthes scabra]